MSEDDFSHLISIYKHNNIPTYTELILGLPGETKESFYNGIDRILQSGQHSVIEIYDCLVLPNSTLANPNYMLRNQIKTVRLPYVQQHTSSGNMDITEYCDTVISTFSLSEQERGECKYFSVVVQCFHSMGLLRCIAVFLYFEYGISYRRFYSSLSDWLEKTDATWNLFPQIKKKIKLVNDGINKQYIYDSRFGDVFWPMDEGAFLNIVTNINSFFHCVTEWIRSLVCIDDVLSELITFQKTIICTPDRLNENDTFSYDFPAYFAKAFENQRIPLSTKKIKICAKKAKEYTNLTEYAREIVWFGRRNDKTTVQTY